MVDDLEDAVALLRQKRAAHMTQVQRIDAALTALAAVVDEPEDNERPRSPARRPASGPTTRAKILLLANESDRDWSVPEIITEYERRGEPFTGANPDSALRAAIVTCVSKGELYRTEMGRYKATGFQLAEHVLPLSPNGHGPAEEEVSTP